MQADFSRSLSLEEGSEDDVTDQDMSDPTHLSLLRDLGWNDDNNDVSNSLSKPLKKYDDHFVPFNDASLSKHSTNILVQAPRSKAEIQKELLGLKRKALAFRREGKVEDVEEVLKMAKASEAQIVEMDTAKSWKDDESEPMTIKEEPVKEATVRCKHIVDLYALDSSLGIPTIALRCKGEIQREILTLKRKELALWRKEEIEEAKEILGQSKTLEGQIEDFGKAWEFRSKSRQRHHRRDTTISNPYSFSSHKHSYVKGCGKDKGLMIDHEEIEGIGSFIWASMASFDEAPPRNSKNGEKIFKTKCAQCHTIDKGVDHKQGIYRHSSPSL
ncbi:hypothetical protein JHK86_055634 [Glycine max]|nr:hypothetical protein JHK86_055634 [Glycine max]